MGAMDPVVVGIDIDTESVIHAVRERPLLWDTTNAEYSLKDKRSAAWSDICKELLPEWDAFLKSEQKDMVRRVQQRWRNARDCYVKEARSHLIKGRVERQYGYSDQLAFLQHTLRVPLQYAVARAEPAPPSPANPAAPAPTPRPLAKRKGVRLVMTRRNKKKRAASAESRGPSAPPPAAPWEPAAAGADADEGMSPFERRLLQALERRASPLEQDDEDFFNSLGPILRGFTLGQKLEFRTNVLGTAVRLQQGHVFLHVSPAASPLDPSDHSDPIEHKYVPSD